MLIGSQHGGGQGPPLGVRVSGRAETTITGMPAVLGSALRSVSREAPAVGQAQSSTMAQGRGRRTRGG